MSSKPLVSVVMITYGHEKFIEEAINGVLMQECDFEVELIIANDCSPDKTDIIIQKLLKEHAKSSWIKYFRQEKNIGIMPNFLYALEKCRGKYIAMCEGDDFWITKDKLQKQVEFLEKNEDYGLVYTHVKHYLQNSSSFEEFPPRFVSNVEETIPQMLKSKFIEFSTTLFRTTILKQAVNNVRNEFTYGVIGDTRILLETAYFSKIYFLNETTTVYRIVEGSVSHPVNLNKFIYALKDSYGCRKSFVERNSLNPVWLSDSICNTNRALINKAFVLTNYQDVILCVKNLLMMDVLKFCSLKIFYRKMDFKVWLKLLMSILGMSVFIKKNKQS